MGTTADKLVYLEETKADIRAALVEKGLDVPESMPFREYGDLIRNISSLPERKPLDEMTWEEIAHISELRLGGAYFSMGECKAVKINGHVADLDLNSTMFVYIIGIDHNMDKEGPGITFGTFKTSLNNGISIALCEKNYDKYPMITDGYFAMTPGQTSTNDGGWKGCNIRYQALGSTKIKGEDADSTTTSSPVTNSLMAALPGDLRAVMKPMKIYTDNVGGRNGTASNVTMSIDYLPLLAEFEVAGRNLYANRYEKNYQKQYQYYDNVQ